jgi:hypothetical protein
LQPTIPRSNALKRHISRENSNLHSPQQRYATVAK